MEQFHPLCSIFLFFVGYKGAGLGNEVKREIQKD